MHIHIFVATIYLLSCVQLFVTATHQASLSFTVSHSLLKLMSIESVMLSNHLRGTLKSLPQYYKLKTSILQYSATFIHHDYWKNHSFDSMECMYIYIRTLSFFYFPPAFSLTTGIQLDIFYSLSFNFTFSENC